jgi:hypothetical protein
VSVQAPPESTIGVAPLVRPFLPHDYVALHAGLAQAWGKPLVADPRAAGEAYAQAGPAFTAVASDWTILGAAGVVTRWPGVGIGWAVLSPALRGDVRRCVWFTLAARGRLRRLMAEHGYWRVEAEVIATDGAATRFAGALGFAVEGLKRRWGPHGEDAIMYGLVEGPRVD